MNEPDIDVNEPDAWLKKTLTKVFPSDAKIHYPAKGTFVVSWPIPAKERPNRHSQTIVIRLDPGVREAVSALVAAGDEKAEQNLLRVTRTRMEDYNPLGASEKGFSIYLGQELLDR